MRPIDAITLAAEFTGNFQEAYTPGHIRAIIDLAPTIDAVPVVRGKWAYTNPLTDTLVCSECDWNIPGEEFVTNFCPNCGADMREVEDGVL